LFEDIAYRRVGYDELPQTSKYGPSYLSTVWLGVDHSFGLGGPPIIFETMRFLMETHELSLFPNVRTHPSIEFPSPEEPHDYIEQERYYTEEQASLAHRHILKLIHEREMT